MLATARKLAMAWGMHCVLTSDPENQAAMVRKACRIAFDEGFAKAGEGVIIVAGVPLGSPGTTNMVRIAHLDDAGNPVEPKEGLMTAVVVHGLGPGASRTQRAPAVAAQHQHQRRDDQGEP